MLCNFITVILEKTCTEMDCVDIILASLCMKCKHDKSRSYWTEWSHADTMT